MRLRVTISRPRLRQGLREIWIVSTWVAVGGTLAALVFGACFYLAIRSSMRSNTVRVPELAGLDLEQAAESVEPMGLVLQVVDQRHDPAVPSGRVIEQMPRPGFSVRRGRKVKLVMSLGGEVLQVPNLVGQADRAVTIELRQEGFVPGEAARVPSSRAAAGMVIGQVPPPDTPAVPNARIHRLVSDGHPPATWVMPDLTGLARAEAERWVSTAGFRRGTVRRVRMVDVPAGTVVGQLPLAGYPVRARDVVELTLAQ